MTDDLATALRTMADSEQPPVMDVEHVLHEGRHSLMRRRMAALGGGTAVLAASALAVGALTGMGSGVDGGTNSAASQATYVIDPHDPVVTHWQFAYVPPGMAAYGGYDPTEPQKSTMLESQNSLFQLELIPMDAPIRIGVAKGESAPTEKVPVKVPGTTTAYWHGYGNGRITLSNGEGGQMATLDIRLKSGQWIELIANNIETRADWKEQILKAAAGVVHQDRSVPMPFQITGVPHSFMSMGGDSRIKSGVVTANVSFSLSPDRSPNSLVGVYAFTAGSEKNPTDPASPFTDTCKDSKGLTICVSIPKTEPAAIKALGGPQALLDRVASLGTDPANWTTDVLR